MRKIQVRWASLFGVLCWLLVAGVHSAVADNIGVAGSEQDVAAYTQALTKLGFETQMVSAESLADVEQLAPLTHLVVANADELSVAQQHAIRDYVEGGGLLVGTELTSKSLPLLLGVEYRVYPQHLRAFYAPKTRSRQIPISFGFPQGEWIEPRVNQNAYDWRVWLCPDRPEVRRHLIEAYAEAIEKYELDGAWLDMIRYPTVNTSCEFDYSRQQRAVFAKEHPEYKSEEEIVYRHCEHSIVSFVEELRKAVKAVNPEAELAAYTWPLYANKYPLDWHSRRCSHRHAPQWTLERLVNGAAYLISPGYAKKFHEYTEGAPMIDVGWKDADETRNEIRLAGASGAKGIFIYYYHYFAIYPEEKMQVTAEELVGQWE